MKKESRAFLIELADLLNRHKVTICVRETRKHFHSEVDGIDFDIVGGATMEMGDYLDVDAINAFINGADSVT